MKINAFLQSVSNGLKTNATQNKQEKSTSEALLADYKSGPTSSVQSVFDKYQIKPTSDDIKQVSAFMSGAKGTEAEKLQTLDIALYKGIEPTRDNLMTMHQAVMHDNEVVGALVDVEVEPVTGDAAKKVVDALKLPAEVKAALKREIDKGATLKEAVVEVSRAINDYVNKAYSNKSISDSSSGYIDIHSKSLAKMINAIEAFAASKPDVMAQILTPGGKGIADKTKAAAAIFVEAAIADAKSGVIATSSGSEATSERLPQGVADTSLTAGLLKAQGASEPTSLNQNQILSTQALSNQIITDQIVINTSSEGSNEGQSSDDSAGAESKLQMDNVDSTSKVTTITTNENVVASEDVSSVEGESSSATELNDEALLSMMNDMVEALLENTGSTLNTLMETMELKTYLVETTTEATMRAKTTFETFRAETSNLLKQAIEPRNEAAMAGNLSKVIEKLNHIILKSDVTLFTDMYTEKKLLLMASELDKAQELTRQGDLSKAQAIVKSAIGLLEQIKFNPSQRRVQVFAQTKIEQLTDALEKPEKTTVRLDAHIKHQLENTQDVQGSKMARDILETMRYLGLNHEMEVAESLENKNNETIKDWNQSNVKEILLKLMKEESNDRPVESVGQNLMNLSGQQMMNDSGSKEQPFYFFNLPIMDGEELGNMKVYMKGASKNSQMDWKNAELYFGVTLKASGPLGIKVKIQQQKVDLQVMSDDLATIKAPLEQVIEELESFGYSKGDIKFSSYSKDTGIVVKPQLDAIKNTMSTSYDGKGFDFKI